MNREREKERREFSSRANTWKRSRARDGEADNIVSLRAARGVGLFVIFIRVRARIAAETTEATATTT